MKLGIIEVSQHVLDASYAAELDALETPAYDELAEQTALLTAKPQYKERRDAAALTPLTYFAVQAALRVMNDEAVAGRLPKEIYQRAVVAGDCARLMMTTAVTQSAAKHYYTTNPHLALLYHDRNLGLPIVLQGIDPKTNKVLPALVDAAFYDASLVMGGALRFLQKEKDLLASKPAADIIAKSVDLHMISGVPDLEDDRIVRMYKYLGWPYAGRDHYERMEDKVTFKPATRAFIRELYAPSRGCPARWLRRQADPPTNLLSEAWVDMATLYLPPGAIASGGLQRRVKLRA
ncbi:MAG TPA: hypothetical protein VLE73_01640 [Candidatus Saccharimonadales bacterium]|nr:hypothetical protein [Candidatus Saccharimonadales bacterium]